jgi:imidazolonepropionase-like amidohydrolase
VLFTNFRLFDGKGPNLRSGLHLLVDGNKIAALETGARPAPAGGRTIDCGGRVLMPGLIDAHWHATFAALTISTLLSADVGYIHLAASAEAQRTLMRGFTTVRDVGGPSFALKKAIDEGLISGPRIFPSGAMISQTAGHGDFRSIYEVPRTGTTLTRSEAIGATAIADSADEVRRRTREQLMAGASQIKLAVGGGVSSLRDPLDTTQFTAPEIRAAVEAAEDWGAYVTVHVYTPIGIKRALDAGVKCIEHGQLTDEDAVRMMADKGIWWSLQPFIGSSPDDGLNLDAEQQAKLKAVFRGTDVAYGLAIKPLVSG